MFWLVDGFEYLDYWNYLKVLLSKYEIIRIGSDLIVFSGQISFIGSKKIPELIDLPRVYSDMSRCFFHLELNYRACLSGTSPNSMAMVGHRPCQYQTSTLHLTVSPCFIQPLAGLMILDKRKFQPPNKPQILRRSYIQRISYIKSLRD